MQLNQLTTKLIDLDTNSSYICILLDNPPKPSKTMSFTQDIELDSDSETFPYPKQVTRSTFLQDLQIDETNPTKSLTDLNSSEFQVDKFLFEHYRYTVLDDLQNELNVLLKELDQELFDLVNDDYFEFIKLGKALDGGEGLIDTLRIDVGKYRKKLVDEDLKLSKSQDHVRQTVDNLQNLKQLQKHASNMLLLDTLMGKFETLLNKTKSTAYIQILKQLTSLYLSIHQLLSSIPATYQFMINKSEHLTMLRHEFKAVLDEYLRNAILNQTDADTATDIVEILGIYSIVGDQSKALEIIKETTAASLDLNKIRSHDT
ncbi:hypothetical protein WICPIJ_000927 [Wickerhamomyces pijperi]|uniref:Conserved oligomeric Golgi complex subunit 2 n=1 Tax=Wickerhamomyces pijperi TaxID=599730 RepID=A0A9P8TR78_WICPI|nr:hypothetical protein WICPIJ_000927 [Wickerhamomyces pijperi]